MTGNQLSLFRQEHTEREERPPAPQGGAPASSPSPAPPLAARPAYKSHDERLAQLGLRYGCAHVYRYSGRLYAWGDFTHCQAEDITHNIKTLAQRLAQQPGLTHFGKAYDSDTYRGSEKLDLERITREVEGIYKEKLFEIDIEGNAVGEAHGR